MNDMFENSDEIQCTLSLHSRIKSNGCDNISTHSTCQESNIMGSYSSEMRSSQNNSDTRIEHDTFSMIIDRKKKHFLEHDKSEGYKYVGEYMINQENNNNNNIDSDRKSEGNVLDVLANDDFELDHKTLLLNGLMFQKGINKMRIDIDTKNEIGTSNEIADARNVEMNLICEKSDFGYNVTGFVAVMGSFDNNNKNSKIERFTLVGNLIEIKRTFSSSSSSSTTTGPIKSYMIRAEIKGKVGDDNRKDENPMIRRRSKKRDRNQLVNEVIHVSEDDNDEFFINEDDKAFDGLELDGVCFHSDSEENEIENESKENEARERARKWRKIENVRLAKFASKIIEGSDDDARYICPTPTNVNLVSSCEKDEFAIAWDIISDGPESYYGLQFECVLNIIQMPKFLNMQEINLSSLVFSDTQKFPREYEKIISLRSSACSSIVANSDDSKSSNQNGKQSFREILPNNLSEGDHFVCIWVRPTSSTLKKSVKLQQLPMNKIIRAATLPESKKILVRSKRAAPSKIFAHIAGKNTCVLTLEQPVMLPKQVLEIRMEKFNESAKDWELVRIYEDKAENMLDLKSSSGLDNNGNGNYVLARERIFVTSNPPKNTIKLLIPGVPDNCLVRFGVMLVDHIDLVTDDIKSKYAKVILGKPSDIVYSNSKNTDKGGDCDEVVCTICQEGIVVPIGNSKVDDTISVPCNCSHMFHSSCLKNWTKLGKSSCPNCCVKFTHDVIFKGTSIFTNKPLCKAQ